MSRYPSFVIPERRRACARRGHVYDMPVVPGTEMCLRCHNRFALNVQAIVDDWTTLQHSVVKRPTSGGRSEKVSTSGHGDVGGLWNPLAVSAIAEITDWAGFVTRTIIRDRPLPPPKDVRVTHIAATSAARWDEMGRRYSMPLDLPARERHYTRVVDTENYTHGIASETTARGQLRAIATWHARWLTGYPTLGRALVDDALALHEMVTNAIMAVGVRRIEIPNAYCRQFVEETELGPIECRAPMVAVIRPQDSARASEILCTSDPSHRRIPVEEWILAR